VFEQPEVVPVTVKVAVVLGEFVIDEVDSLVLHKYAAVVPLAVNVTELPAQIIASLLAAPDASITVILTVGIALTVIVILAVLEHPDAVPVTV
jgi:hypothetical protein